MAAIVYEARLSVQCSTLEDQTLTSESILNARIYVFPAETYRFACTATTTVTTVRNVNRICASVEWLRACFLIRIHTALDRRSRVGVVLSSRSAEAQLRDCE